ncbi:hypothetical protein PVA44_06680 (plasmid) [Entomospira nematocerorum]|uniref:Lipoprotein n=1 Tax=Entomospira nematocerorum TaxID=2719987 RepID=A0A968GG21_9SPIO|nr:hypothetical protein [Entomospira nematocera]NIZ47590.1 hypothetical protein [Entomospira nematocera]WDI34594.1 hypothetical protein PVA44_06680 [Entomospira nematocera]
MKQSWLSVLFLLLSSVVIGAQSHMDRDRAIELLDTFLYAQSENTTMIRSGQKPVYPDANKVYLWSQKEFRSIYALNADHDILVNSASIAKELDIPLYDLYMAVIVFESLGVKSPNAAINHLLASLASMRKELEGVQSTVQTSFQKIMGENEKITFLDLAVFMLVGMNYNSQVRSQIMTYAFDKAYHKEITALMKQASYYHYTLIDTRKNDRSIERSNAMVTLSKQETMFNMASYQSYLERAFGKENVNRWQGRQLIGTPGDVTGQVALSLALTILYPESHAERLAAHEAVFPSSVEAATQLFRAQTSVIKQLETFYTKYMKSKK